MLNLFCQCLAGFLFQKVVRQYNVKNFKYTGKAGFVDHEVEEFEKYLLRVRKGFHEKADFSLLQECLDYKDIDKCNANGILINKIDLRLTGT